MKPSPSAAHRQGSIGQPSQPGPGSIFVRAVALLVMAVTLDLWSTQHLGIGLSKQPAGLALAVGSLTIVAARLGHLFEEGEKKLLVKRVRSVARMILSTPALVFLGLVLAVPVVSCSSVAILAEPPVDLRTVRLASAELPAAKESLTFGAPPRFLVRTGPFGRSFRLSVPGYLPAVVQVPCLTGLRVVPDRDLRRAPTLLLRPSLEALASLENGGMIEVSVGKGKKRKAIPPSRCNCRASFLLGSQRPIPAELPAQWRLELLAHDVPEASPQFSWTLLAWKKPRLLVGDDLFPGQLVSAVVKSRAGAIKARAELTVGEEDFLDVVME